MAITLLALSVRCKRDILLARQRARQIAGLLGFDPVARLEIAARAFEIAWTAHRQGDGQTIIFQIEDQVLRVFSPNLGARRKESQRQPRRLDPCGVERLMNRLRRASPESTILRLETPLPSPILSLEDLAWAVQELSRQTPLNVFEEIRQQNLEMLRLLPGLPVPATQPAPEAGRTRAA